MIHGDALTWAQAEAVIDTRTFPGGVSAVVDFPTDGADNGTVRIVGGTDPAALVLQGGNLFGHNS